MNERSECCRGEENQSGRILPIRNLPGRHPSTNHDFFNTTSGDLETKKKKSECTSGDDSLPSVELHVSPLPPLSLHVHHLCSFLIELGILDSKLSPADPTLLDATEGQQSQTQTKSPGGTGGNPNFGAVRHIRPSLAQGQRMIIQVSGDRRVAAEMS
jgi:hypothetical protein